MQHRTHIQHFKTYPFTLRPQKKEDRSWATSESWWDEENPADSERAVKINAAPSSIIA
jgi:hypothetical protein